MLFTDILIGEDTSDKGRDEVKRILSLASLVILLLTGCNQNQNTDQFVKRMNNPGGNGESLLEKRQEPPVRENRLDYENAGKKQNMAHERFNSVQITERVREIVEEVDHLSYDSVMINGRDLWVVAHHNEPLTQRNIIRENAELHKRLEEAFPQFHIEVRVEESMR